MTTKPVQTASDMPEHSMLWTLLPKKALPYVKLMRLDRPIGTWLLYWPCLWAIALAVQDIEKQGLQMVEFAALFGIGSLVMRGAGCTFNDIVDKDFDAAVARTATRPIAAGDVSRKKAFVFLCLLLLCGLAVLLQFNSFTVLMGCSALLLVAAYPFMKRITYWPQAWLGLTFNWGALVGYTAMTGKLELPCMLLYAAGFFWTLGYDTIYAHQDKEDDLKIGVKSSALALGNKTLPVITVFYGFCLFLLACSMIAAGQGAAGFVVLGCSGFLPVWLLKTLDIDSPANCLARFKANRHFGLLVFLALLAGCY